MPTSYSVENAHCNLFATGLPTKQDAIRTAQRIADRLGETVYYCEDRAGAKYTAVRPLRSTPPAPLSRDNAFALLCDVGPNRATVIAVGDRDAVEAAWTAGADCIAALECDLPEPGERVWISRESERHFVGVKVTARGC